MTGPEGSRTLPPYFPLVLLPSIRKQKRKVAEIRWGGYDGPVLYRWSCPTGCGFTTSELQERDAVQAANAHECEAGWCAIPATHPSQPSGLVVMLQPTQEDRERWLQLRVQRALTRAKAKPKL